MPWLPVLVTLLGGLTFPFPVYVSHAPLAFLFPVRPTQTAWLSLLALTVTASLSPSLVCLSLLGLTLTASLSPSLVWLSFLGLTLTVVPSLSLVWLPPYLA